MKYDFDTVYDRRNTDSVKWNVKENELPMWVADMDFKTAPEIINVLVERAENGIFGYTDLTDEWYNAYINWWDRRHGLKMERDGIRLRFFGDTSVLSDKLLSLIRETDEITAHL